MAVLQSELPSGAELCLRSSDDTNEAVGMEVEGVTDVDEEEGTEPSSSRLIMTVPAVSCISLCTHCYTQCTDIH
jgi:hypothetical protein